AEFPPLSASCPADFRSAWHTNKAFPPFFLPVTAQKARAPKPTRRISRKRSGLQSWSVFFFGKQAALRIPVGRIPENPFLITRVIDRLDLRTDFFRAISDVPVHPGRREILQPGSH